MWQVRSELGDGRIGKLVARSWARAVLELIRWRLKGRAAKLSHYVSESNGTRPPLVQRDLGD